MMTVASQSPYDLGVNAAQLLLNRLNSNEHLRPQTIVLPSRLIVRQSCGGEPSSIKPETVYDNLQGQLIPSLPHPAIEALAAAVHNVLTVALPPNDLQLFQGSKTQIELLKQILRRNLTDPPTILHFEYAITNSALYRYVLERDPEVEDYAQTSLIAPEDQIEFAQRSGLAAIPCRFPYQPTLVPTSNGDLPTFDFPLLTDLLDFFDRYVRAARNTNVGIAADFRLMVGDTLRIVESLGAIRTGTQRAMLQEIANDLADYQTKVIQVICDRFGADIAFVLFSDDLADTNGLRLSRDLFEEVFSKPVQRLLHPAQEHRLPTVLHTPGVLVSAISLVQQLGFDGVYIAQTEGNDLAALRQAADGQLSFMGGIPVSALTHVTQPGDISPLITQLGENGTYVAGVSGEINDQIAVSSFFSLVSALNSVCS